MRVFITATSLRAEYGGPAYSVARLAVALANQGHEVALWAADGSTHAIASGVIQLAGDPARALSSFGTPDVIHDNGLWRPHNHAIAKLSRGQGIPRIVSTRGMLEPWALSHKRLRKRAAWVVYQRRDLSGASALHATSTAEGANVERMQVGRPVAVIPNAVDLPPVPERRRNEVASRTALFLGRLYPVKGLPMLIAAWADVRPKDWRLVVAGPDERGHRRELEALVARHRLGDVIAFTGAVQGDARSSLLEAADLFVLPTHSESYGMAIAEALAHSLPVLTTLSAPWPMLEEKKCGWLADPDTAGVAKALQDAVTTGRRELTEMGRRGRELIESMPSWNDVAVQFAALYVRAAGSL